MSDVTNPDPKFNDSDPPAPPTIAEVKAAVVAARDTAKSRLDSARARRDALNREIKVLDAEYTEAQRVARAFEPRSSKPKAVKKAASK